MPKIELIYCPDCPHVNLARERLSEALTQAVGDVVTQWQEWDSTDPEAPDYVRGFGSPTILINGQDVVPEEGHQEALSCRVYRGPQGKPSGAPSVETILGSLSDPGPRSQGMIEKKVDGATGTEVARQLKSVAVPARSARLVLEVIRKLARGRTVGRSDVILTHPDDWKELQILGADFDEDGNIVGMGGLTIRETTHRFDVGNRRLYTWCALDTLFLPRLLMETAEIESACPITRTQIRLRVSPDGIERADPTGTVVSLVPTEVSELWSTRETDVGNCAPNSSDRNRLFGIQGSFCSQVHFFRSREDAARWLPDHPGAVIVSLEEAFRIGQETCRDLLADAE